MRPVTVVTDGDGSDVCVPHARPRAHMERIQETRHHPSPVTRRAAAGCPRCLIPFDRREGLTVEAAADLAARDVRTLRRWCVEHGIGRRIAGGPWTVSRVALAMLLDGDAAALAAYLSGDRGSDLVRGYFDAAGLSDLPRRWVRQESELV